VWRLSVEYDAVEGQVLRGVYVVWHVLQIGCVPTEFKETPFASWCKGDVPRGELAQGSRPDAEQAAIGNGQIDQESDRCNQQ
jgi:hypothetical protein